MRLTLILLSILLLLAPQTSTKYSAVVTPKEATFTIPVQPRDQWTWRRADTRDNQQEYKMDVTVMNEGKEYAFGFYVWKYHGASQRSGSLSDLIHAGQKSVFERAQSRLMTIVRDAKANVSVKGDVVIISLSDKDVIKRLFSSKPAEVVFKIKIPGDPDITEKVPVTYQS